MKESVPHSTRWCHVSIVPGYVKRECRILQLQIWQINMPLFLQIKNLRFLTFYVEDLFKILKD